MIVIDTSALMAIALEEPDADRFKRCIGSQSPCLMSAGSAVEASMLLCSRLGLTDGVQLERYFRGLTIQLASVNPSQIYLAHQAFARFGKGRHPAGLNLGDCFAYALAKEYDAPLLFKGTDLAQTDIVPALP